MNYRKLYEKKCNIKIPKDYDIHHIDLDHNNNDFNNLVMLPKELHNKYHSLLNEYKNSGSCLVNFIITGNEVNSQTYTLHLLKKLIEVVEECNKWYDYKLYLVKKLPNIHNIEVLYE